MADPISSPEPSQPTPQATPVAAPSAEPSAPSAPQASPSSVPPSAAGGTTTPAASPSWLDGLRSKGVNLGDNEDQALQRLQHTFQAAQQYQHLQPHVQKYLQHSGKFEQWLEDQAKQQAPQPESPWAKHWSAPEYNPRWQTMVQKDADGNLTGPPEVVAKIQAYQQYRAEQADKFMSNPFEYMDGYVTERAKQIATEQFNELYGRHQWQQSVQNFEQQNADWLYQKDQAGQYVMQQQFDPRTGRLVAQPALSPYGQQFLHHLNTAQGTPEQRQQYALIRTRLDHVEQENQQYRQWFQQQQQQVPQAPQNPLQAANNGFLRQANGPLPRPAGNSTPSNPPVTAQNLEQVAINRLNALKGGGKLN